MRKVLGLLSISFVVASCNHTINPNDFETKYETSGKTETATYTEVLEWWEKLDKASPYVSIQDVGETDAGLPLKLIVISPTKNFSPEKINDKNRTVLLINNGIHPGEPDGIDASMLWAREILSKEDFASHYQNSVFLIIPTYNIGGALNRGCCSRANQNGPIEYGFRGNARNLDLNRDFIKCDSKNAKSFTALFNAWNPDVYLETHVSNGADYQYVMTYLFSHPDKMAPSLSEFTLQTMIPSLVGSMKAANEEMIPYVNVFGTSPDSGYFSFYDSPRYSTGYAALHNSIGLLTETHMLKSYDQRVDATFTFIHQLADFTNNHGAEIKQLRKKAENEMLAQDEFVIDWSEDDSLFEMIEFKGFEVYFDTSKVTNSIQHYFDSSKPWTKQIKFYNHLKAKQKVTAPAHYLLPRAWSEAVDLMALNNVEMRLIEKDTQITAMAYKIEDYKTVNQPYEGHYLHFNTSVNQNYVTKIVRAGEYYLINVQQAKKRYIIETLEPNATDALFNWNFFDEILQQKEWFSSYVFDLEAEELLAKNETLRKSFAAMKKDSSFTQDKFNQLYYIYRNSSRYERERHMVYPVLRVE